MQGLIAWDGRRVLLTIARLVGRKGQDTVIRALPQLATMYAAVAAQGLERVRREFERELRARTLWETCR